MCLSLFRSLANFVAHKRDHCHHFLRDVRHVYRRDPGEYSGAGKVGGFAATATAGANSDSDDDGDSSPTTAYVQPEPIETIVPESQWNLGQ